MSRKSEIRDLVLGILLESEMARNSDRYLYIKVLENTNPDALHTSARVFLFNTDLPKMETVSRARRWAQEHYPTVRPTVPIQYFRESEEIEYKDLFNNRQAWNVAMKTPEIAEKGVKRWA